MKKTLLFISLLGACFSAADANACDTVKLYADLGKTRFAASGIVVQMKGQSYIVSADHFLPVDRVDFPIVASSEAGITIQLMVQKRDWGSDVMILAPKDTEASEAIEKLKPCRFSSASLNTMTDVTLAGYPAQDFSPAKREGTIADANAQEARIARPLRQLKILTLAERGMSGGAVLNSQNQVVGLIQKEWTSITTSSKGGAFALAAPDLLKQLSAMMNDQGSSIEMPLPFKIRRVEAEIQLAGFRMQDRPENKLIGARNEAQGSGGGHPDGIGGEVPGQGVEIVGLSGEAVPESFRAMEKVLRNVQARGGVRMVIQSTESGQPIFDLIALARWVLTATPDAELDYTLLDVSPNSAARAIGSPDALLEEAIVLISLLSNINPGLREYAQLIKNSYDLWIKTRASTATRSLFQREPEFQPELDRILDLDPELWSKVVDLQTTLLQLKKSVNTTVR